MNELIDDNNEQQEANIKAESSRCFSNDILYTRRLHTRTDFKWSTAKATGEDITRVNQNTRKTSYTQLIECK